MKIFCKVFEETAELTFLRRWAHRKQSIRSMKKITKQVEYRCSAIYGEILLLSSCTNSRVSMKTTDTLAPF